MLMSDASLWSSASALASSNAESAHPKSCPGLQDARFPYVGHSNIQTCKIWLSFKKNPNRSHSQLPNPQISVTTRLRMKTNEWNECVWVWRGASPLHSCADTGESKPRYRVKSPPETSTIHHPVLPWHSCANNPSHTHNCTTNMRLNLITFTFLRDVKLETWRRRAYFLAPKYANIHLVYDTYIF